MTAARLPKRCGNCKHHVFDDQEGTSCCMNPESEFFSGYPEYDEVCSAWERDPKRMPKC